MTFSRLLAQDVLKNLVGKPTTNLEAQTGLWIGMSTTTPSEVGGNVSEPGANFNYSRIYLASGDWDPPTAADPTVMVNGATQQFPQNTGAGNWGSLTDMLVYDSRLGGNFLGFGEINGGTPLVINDTDTASFASGAATISLT
jgi:hypothetical protein